MKFGRKRIQIRPELERSRCDDVRGEGTAEAGHPRSALRHSLPSFSVY